MPDDPPVGWLPDRRRLERILAPWAAEADGPVIRVLDPAGTVLAGPVREGDDGRVGAAGVRGEGAQTAADILVGGRLAGRVVATPRHRGRAVDAAGVRAVAVALAELVAEGEGRAAAEAALRAHRADDTAVSLGTDAAELARGRRQQRSIVSLVAPDVPGYELASHYAAAREVGGDFFELFRLPRRGRPLGIVIADVTGKGLDAALLMAFARPVIHTALGAARGPAEALERTNRVLVGERRGTLFITALCAVLRPSTGQVRMASAGHEAPLLVPADGGPVGSIGRAGVLLGAFSTLATPEVELELAPGDALVAYTDGVTDAVSPSGERFGDGRLLAAIEDARGGSAQEIVDAVREAVALFQGAAEPADDLTLVAVRRAVRRRRARAESDRPG